MSALTGVMIVFGATLLWRGEIHTTAKDVGALTELIALGTAHVRKLDWPTTCSVVVRTIVRNEGPDEVMTPWATLLGAASYETGSDLARIETE